MKKAGFKILLLCWALCSMPLAHADDASMSCDAVEENFFLSVDDIIGAFEIKLNQEIQKYVSVLDFDVGNPNFGAKGTGSLGYVELPEYDQQNPKQYLNSAIHDLSVSPGYSIDAMVLGANMNVLLVQMTAGQGCKAKKDAAACMAGTKTKGQSGKDRLSLDVLVAGIMVYSTEGTPAETEAFSFNEASAVTMLSNLPSAEKKGSEAKLENIKRGFAGSQPMASIPIADVLTVTFDAGYDLHAGLVLSYAVDIVGFKMGGSKSYSVQSKMQYTMDNRSLTPQTQQPGGVPNPAFDDKDMKSCPFGSTNCKLTSSKPKVSASNSFWYPGSGSANSNLGAGSFEEVAMTLGNNQVKEALRDAKIVDYFYRETLDKLKADPNMQPEEKKALMDSMDIKSIKKEMKGLDQLIGNVNYKSETLVSAFNAVEQAIKTMNKGGVPPMSAAAGVALDGHAGLWVNVQAQFNFANVVNASAGVEGGLTLLDAKAGLGVAVSSQSQYVDLTGQMDYEIMKGSIRLLWSYSILGAIGGSGSENLANFPGTTRTTSGMIARMDFDSPDGSDWFFWCSDLFGNGASLDPERCKDGGIPTRKLVAGLAAHDKYQEFVLDEHPTSQLDTCAIMVEGKFIYSSNANQGDCQKLLPKPGDTLNNPPNNQGIAPHPLVTANNNNEGLFLTFLRNKDNKPIINISAITGSGETSEQYTAPLAVQFAKGDSKSHQIVPLAYLPKDSGMTVAGIENRIFTFTSHGIISDVQVPNTGESGTHSVSTVQSADDMSTVTDSRFQIKLDGIKNGSGSTFGSDEQIFVGHVLALPNESIIDLAENYKLGQCNIAESGLYRRLLLAGKPYPSEGVPTGSTIDNAAIPRLGCYLGKTNPNQGEVEMWEACQLRAMMMRQDCFPQERLADLIEVGNLTPDKILEYFSPTNKRISGNLDFGQTITRDYISGFHPYGTTKILPPANHLHYLPVNVIQPPSGTQWDNEQWLKDRNQADSLVRKVISGGAQNLCNGFAKENIGSGTTQPLSFANPDGTLNIGVGNLTWKLHPTSPGGPNSSPNLYSSAPVNTAWGLINDIVVAAGTSCISSGHPPYNFILPMHQGQTHPVEYEYFDYVHSNNMNENTPHQVVLWCEQQQYFVAAVNNKPAHFEVAPTMTWRGAIRSASIIKPYVIEANGKEFPLDELNPSSIAEIYNEAPIQNGNGYQFSASMCNSSDPKNVNNFPYGTEYGAGKIDQMLNGTLEKLKMIKAIQRCMAEGACEYVSTLQRVDNQPVCSMQASLVQSNQGSTPIFTKLADSSATNLDSCILSNYEFSSPESFCKKYETDITSQITSPGLAKVIIAGKWEQKTNVGTVLESTLRDPIYGFRDIGQCVYNKNANGTVTFVGAAKSNLASETKSSECSLNAVGKNGASESLNIIPTSGDPASVTADMCKSSLGYKTGTMEKFNDVRTVSTCENITGNQLLKLRERGIIPQTGNGTFKLNAVVNTPGYPNHGESILVGNCVLLEATINKKINEQTKCTLRMSSGTMSANPIDVFMPPPAPGVSRLDQCRAQAAKFNVSFGNPPVCSEFMRQRAEYAALIAFNENYINYSLYLGDTEAMPSNSCKGAALNNSNVIDPAEYNQDCVARLTASNEAPNQFSNLSLKPSERMWSIDPNKWLSADTLKPLPIDKCRNYWSYKMTKYAPNGDLENKEFCNSIAKDVKALLPVIRPAIAAPNSNNDTVNGTWSSQPLSGTVTTVNAFARVFAPLPPCTGPNCKTAKTIPNGSTPVNNDTVVINGSGNEKQDDPNDGGGGAGTPPEWQNSSKITSCNYEFKEINNQGDWDLVDSNWQRPVAPSSWFGGILKESRCVKDMNNHCIPISAGDVVVYAGSGQRAIERYSAGQVPGALDQNLADQICNAHYSQLVPLSRQLVSDPNKRFPLWYKIADSKGDVEIPNLTDATPYYCVPKNCDLKIEFGAGYSELTQSPWKDKLTAMPTTEAACKTYYKGQVEVYCEKSKLLQQFPDNMDVNLNVDFDGHSTLIGVCPATHAKRVCNIGQRNKANWYSWISTDDISKLEEVRIFDRVIYLPRKSKRAPLTIPNYFPNTLAACVESAKELNANNALCNRTASDVNRNKPFEIVVQFGVFTQTISACNEGPPETSDSEGAQPDVAKHALGMTLEETSACNIDLNLKDYVEGATLQVATCPDHKCTTKDLKVIYAAKPKVVDTYTAKVNFNDILKSTWNSTMRGIGSVYVNQVDAKGNLGEWVELDKSIYSKYAELLTSECKVVVNDLTAKITGNVCEQRNITLDRYVSGATVDVGVCTTDENHCSQDDFTAVDKPKIIETTTATFLQFNDVLMSTWVGTGNAGTIAVRQQYSDGKISPWAMIPKKSYQQAAQEAFDECGVNP